jgi:hypothetical protein
MTDLLLRCSEAATDEHRRDLAVQIQAEFHQCELCSGWTVRHPAAYRSDLHGTVPFAFPVFWKVGRQ